VSLCRFVAGSAIQRYIFQIGLGMSLMTQFSRQQTLIWTKWEA
jgi:hypothetical protein